MAQETAEFLKNIPRAMVAEQRYFLEGLSFALDAVEICYSRLIKTLDQYDFETIQNISGADRAALFSDVWTIIDRVHLTCVLINSMFISSKEMTNEGNREISVAKMGDKSWLKSIEKFHSDYDDDLREVRAMMDHLPSNFSRYLKKANQKTPIQGMLSYVYTTPSDWEKGKAYLVGLTNNAVSDKGDTGFLPNPIGKNVTSPISCIHLTANDRHFLPRHIDISSLYQDCAKLKRILNTDFAEFNRSYVEEYAAQSGQPLEALMESNAHSPVAVMSIQFSDGDES